MNQFLLTQENSAQLNQFAHIIEFAIGNWSNLPKNEILVIGKILRHCKTPVLSRAKEAGRILNELHQELFNRRFTVEFEAIANLQQKTE